MQVANASYNTYIAEVETSQFLDFHQQRIVMVAESKKTILRMAAFQMLTDLFIIREQPHKTQPQPNYIARVHIRFLLLPTSININGRARRPLSLISHCDTE
jgi:hypothetical protein